MRFQRGTKSSSMIGMPSGIDPTAHTERTLSQCDASLDSEYLESHELPTSRQKEVTVLRSSLRSPSRRSKERKQEIRSRLGIFGNITTEDSQVSTTRSPAMHDFWGSRFFLSIYAIVLVALLSRQWVVLHGLLLVIVWPIMDRLWIWGLFIWQSNELKSILRHVRWFSRFAFTQAGKAAEGDRLRSYIATQTFMFWTGTGKNIIRTIIRVETRWIRTRLLRETEDTLQQQLTVERTWLDKAFRF